LRGGGIGCLLGLAAKQPLTEQGDFFAKLQDLPVLGSPQSGKNRTLSRWQAALLANDRF